MILTLLSCHLQLEDAEFAAQSAQKSKKKLEEDVADLQSQFYFLLLKVEHCSIVSGNSGDFNRFNISPLLEQFNLKPLTQVTSL